MKVKVMKLDAGAIIPKYAKSGDAGMDLYAVSFGIDQNNELLFAGNEYIYKFSPEIEMLMGDVNYDGFLNVLDVVSIVNMILGNDTVDLIADMNGDGGLNIQDIILLMNIILTDE